MTCYRPLGAFRVPEGVVFHKGSADGKPIKPDVWLPCGMCIGCRAKRASDWSLRCMHEASLYEASCFVTLTYARDCLPPGGSLCHRDFQLFMKRLRKQYGSVRFFMCGEYGERLARPHYHACLFGVDFRSDRQAVGKSASGYAMYDSPALDGLWTHGRTTVQDLTRETAGYCARYVMKKLMGESARRAHAEGGASERREPEYACMSLKPGIGEWWYKLYGSDVYPHDYVVSDGRKERPPKYYDKLFGREDRFSLDDIKESRESMSRAAHADNTDERLRVREEVYKAKVRNQSRSLE